MLFKNKILMIFLVTYGGFNNMTAYLFLTRYYSWLNVHAILKNSGEN